MANHDDLVGAELVSAVASDIESEDLEWTAAQNELTALPPEVRQQYLGVIVTPEEMQQLRAETQMQAAAESRAEALFGAPTSFDWRNKNGQNYVTPVKNQGACGSCVSFCTCAVMESAARIKLGNPSYNIDLSEAFCQFCGGASCSGWGLTSGLDFAKSTGVTDEACMPYQATNLNCANERCSDWQNRLTKISSYAPHSTMAARKDAIATKGPLLAGMAVYSDFYAYSSGVYVKTSSAIFKGLHCVCVVGYDDTQQCWIVKNSWGAGWGDSGFVRIRYGQPDLLIDTDWSFYSVVIDIQEAWHSNLTVNQTYASHHSQNAWAHFQDLGWRKIKTGAADGVTNMLALFVEAKANGKKVTIYADGDHVYRAYLL
jgi:C1A family cysteine protease